MKAFLRRLGTVAGFLLVVAFGLVWLGEWVVLALWLFPGVVGMYLVVRGGRPEQALFDHFLGVAALACTWPWGWALGEYVLPLMSRFAAHLFMMPFWDERGAYDPVVVVIAVLMSVAGYQGLVLGVAQQVAAPRSSYEIRSRVYRAVGYSGIGLGIIGLVLTDHSITAALLAVVGGFAVHTFASEDPAIRLKEMRERKARTY